MESPQFQNTSQEAKRATYTVRCSKCGYRNPPIHNFCGICGEALYNPGQNVISKPSEAESSQSHPQDNTQYAAHQKEANISTLETTHDQRGGSITAIARAVLGSFNFGRRYSETKRYTDRSVSNPVAHIGGEEPIDKDKKILGMDQKTFYIVLSIGGGLLFTWASGQIANMPPDFLMPYVFVQRNHMWINFYRVLQVVGVVTAIIGGVRTYKNYKQ